MVDPQHLIVIRGNSASGKTTLARELQLAMGRGTANIGQDHFRRVVLREHDLPNGDNIELISGVAEHCLEIGYHVILEGIFYSAHYGAMLRGLIRDHAGQAHVFYLDIPLEETLRRHSGRPLARDVDPDKLRKWYVASDLLKVSEEMVVDGGGELSSTLHTLRSRIGPVSSRPTALPARFL